MLYSINQYPTLSHEFINTYVSDYDIYAFYLGHNFTINQAFNSPFHEDKTPSFGIYDIGNGKLLFKDFSKGLDGNVINFVKELFNLNDYKAALLKICIDLIINNNKITLKDTKINRATKRIPAEIGVARQPFNEEDLRWWKQFNITKEILELFEVNSIKYLFVGPYIKHIYSKQEPMYVYKVYDKLKIYRPLSNKKEKWYGSLTRNYIQGYKQLPENGDLLIITKSLKDVMCLYSLGYIAISPSSEGILIPQHIINKLKKRFTKIIIFYDNDEPGIHYTKRMCTKYNLESIVIPNNTNEKDITDYFKHYGINKTKSLLNNLIKDETKKEK